VGFDDISIAVHSNPSLTTVRQRLQKTLEIGAGALWRQIEHHEEGGRLY
jgi:DNA-binding LacI/PurR family transcriptional regulator